MCVHTGSMCVHTQPTICVGSHIVCVLICTILLTHDIAQTQILDVEADEAFTLPLLHNVSVLVDSATADIQRLTRQSASEKARPFSPHTSLKTSYVVA